MSEMQSTCDRCGDLKDGHGKLCVACYRFLHTPCPKCTIRTGLGKVVVIKDKKMEHEIDCGHCNNERYILKNYKPYRTS